MNVVSREFIGEFETVVVEKASVQIWPESFDPSLKKRVLLVNVTRSWIDTHHGYLPRRIVNFDRWYCDGKLASNQCQYANGPATFVDDVTIELIPKGGFYPTKGSIKRWTHRQDPNWPSPLEIFEGKQPGPVLEKILAEETKWAVKVSVPDVTPEFDVMKLVNDDALVVDISAQQVLAKNSQGDLIRASAGQVSQQSIPGPTHGWFNTICYLIFGASLILAARIAFTWRSQAH